MGRRFLLILGILLFVPTAGTPARAQDGGGPPAPMPDPTPAAPGELPVPRPLDLPPVDGNLPPINQAGPDQVEAPPSTKANAKDQPVRPLGPVDGEGTPRRSAGPPTPPDDRDLTRTEGTADGPAARRPATPIPGPSAAGETDGPPADRLPVGKQSVALTVDVQSPPTMNLHLPAKVLIVVRNTGNSDAMQVRIRDELPEGLKFLSSEPPPDQVERDSVLTWSRPVVPAGSDMVIAMKVEPVKTGDLEHGASVWFRSGSSAATKVLQPKLTIEQTASAPTVLKGHAVEFTIRVRNDGDGPARDVKVVARLSPGLRYGSGRRAESEVVTDPIPVLAPGQVEELDPLVADAIAEGPASCTVVARSRDIPVQGKDEARSVAEVKVVEPKLEVAVAGPQRRCTDTVAPYEIAVRNPGTAPARKVRVIAVVPPGVRLRSVPDGARYDQATRRLQWSFDSVEPSSTPRKLGFEVTVGDVGKYEVAAEAVATGNLKAESSRLVTEVFGMPDVVLAVTERQRVIDVKGKTVFLIELQNLGTKEATNILLSATVSKNLSVTGSFDQPAGLEFRKNKDGHIVLQDSGGGGIKRLGPGKKLVMGLEVEAAAPDPNAGTCRVQVKHDELPDGVDAMAAVKILPPSSASAEPGGR